MFWSLCLARGPQARVVSRHSRPVSEPRRHTLPLPPRPGLGSARGLAPKPCSPAAAPAGQGHLIPLRCTQQRGLLHPAGAPSHFLFLATSPFPSYGKPVASSLATRSSAPTPLSAHHRSWGQGGLAVCESSVCMGFSSLPLNSSFFMNETGPWRLLSHSHTQP